MPVWTTLLILGWIIPLMLGWTIHLMELMEDTMLMLAI